MSILEIKKLSCRAYGRTPHSPNQKCKKFCFAPYFKSVTRKKNEKKKSVCRTTLGIYEVFLERSGRKIWVRGEPSPEPYIPCYTPRAKRSVARAQRGATERSEFKKYFSFNRSLIGFFFNLNKFVFVLGEGRGD